MRSLLHSHSSPSDNTSVSGEADNAGSLFVPISNGLKRTKKSCQSCRSLKVKCEPSMDPLIPCRRCAKASRGCVFTETSRKRAKKDRDAMVTDLQNKVETLTASLRDRKRQRSCSEASVSFPQPLPRPRRHSELPLPHDSPFASSSFFAPPEATPYIPGDIVDRGIVGLAEADRLLRRYNEVVLPCYPFALLCTNFVAADLRLHYPCLFLAAVYAASQALNSDLYDKLLHEVLSTIATRVIVNSEKSIDLIQV